MKRINRISVFILSVFLFLSMLTCTVGAESETGFREINGAVGESLYADYRKQVSWFDNKEAVGWSEEALDRIIQDVMYPYSARISLLSVRDDASYATEMQLLHAQGTAAGQLTWIYYIDEGLHAFPSVTEKYLWLMDEIDPAVNHDGDPTNDQSISIDFFTVPNTASLRTVEDCYNEMITAVFQQKIQNLENREGSSPDSTAVRGIISNAVLHELPKLSFYRDFYPYFDESDSENYPHYQLQTNPYQTLYAKTAELVRIQRNREAITDQLAQVFFKLYPNDPFPSTANEKISAFHTALATKSTVSEMNGQLQTTLLLLLKDLACTGADTYRTQYLLGSATEEGLAQRIVSATSSQNTLARITPLFQTYEIDLKKADTKDELARYVTQVKSANPSYTSEQRAALDFVVSLYNCDSGVFNTATEHNLSLELIRAKRRLDLLVAYNDALSQTVGYLGASAANSTDLQQLSEELTEKYQAADSMIASAGAIVDPSSLLLDAIFRFADTATEAEARAFENAHALILGITTEQIESAEWESLIAYKDLIESALADAGGTAVGDTGALSAAAITKLESRTSTTGEPTPVLTALGQSYLTIIQAQIAHTFSDNSGESGGILALRRNLSNQQQERVALLSFSVDPHRGLEELIALPSAANGLLQQAIAADSLLDHYCYEIDNPLKNNAMEAYCNLAAQKILGGTLSASEAILQLNRMEAHAEIEQAAEGYTGVPGVREILDAISADLENCPDTASIDAYAENAIFLIENRVTADRMLQKIQTVLGEISEMRFLSEQQRTPYLSAADALRRHLPAVQNALRKEIDETAVNNAVSEFKCALTVLNNAISYTRDAYEQHLAVLELIRRLTHVESTAKALWTTDTEKIYSRFLEETAEQLSLSKDAHDKLTENFLALAKASAQAELEGITALLTKEILDCRYLNEREKAGHTATLEAKKEEAIQAMATAVTASDISLQLGESLNRLLDQGLAVSILEKEACCRILTERLRNAYVPDHYSSDVQAKLTQIVLEYEKKISAERTAKENEAILETALDLIRKETNLLQEAQARNEERLTEVYHELLTRDACYSQSNLSLLKKTYDDAINAIRAPRDVTEWQQIDLLVADALLTMQEICLDRIYTSDKLLSEEVLTAAPDSYEPMHDGYIAMVESKNGLPFDSKLSIRDTKKPDITKTLHLAIKENRIYPMDGTDPGKALLKQLKDARLCAAWQITLDTAMLSSAEQYAVSLLLPKHLREETLIGIVFLREDGSVEFYDIAREGDLLRFETSHFSDFYLICESSANLLPWIIALSILIVCEIIALILLYRRRNGTELDMDSPLSAFALSPLLLKIYRPAGGVGLLWLLGGISLSLAAWIAWLVASELRGKYPETEYPEEDPDEELDEEALEEHLPASDPISVLVSAPKRLLLSDSGPLSQVTVAEANALMPDEIAKEELKAESTLFTNIEIHTGAKKAEINIDTIAEHFNSGDTVTLSLLKEKGLVSKQTGHVKILARGTLDKPLTVIAQDFSIAALKMILLTGGTPIVAKSSPRRSGKR